jgi:HPt (histidine-containing phosphotransfer) domain-containing protein
MTNPINFDELLERVSGNREFILRMLELFFESSNDRVAALREEFSNKNYEELSEQLHKLKGLVGNLSINKVLEILKELHQHTEQRNDQMIEICLTELEKAILEAKSFFHKNPNLTT